MWEEIEKPLRGPNGWDLLLLDDYFSTLSSPIEVLSADFNGNGGRPQWDSGVKETQTFQYS